MIVRDNNLYVNVDIDMFEAALGDKITVPTPYGQVNITIPPGTESGQKFRIRGKGVPHLNSSETGDLYINVHVKIPAIAIENDRNILREMKKRYAKDLRKTLLEKVVYRWCHERQAFVCNKCCCRNFKHTSTDIKAVRKNRTCKTFQDCG